MTISELIKALESAEGPDRDLDLQIGLLLDGWTYGYVLPNFEWLEGFGTKFVKDHEGNVNSSHPGSMYTAYTESVDAAIALCERVLPGWDYGFLSFGEDGREAKVWEHGYHDDSVIRSEGHNPAIALVLVSLRMEAGMSDIVDRLQQIAEASKYRDGGYIPLGLELVAAIDEILRLRALAYCETNKGPMLWKDIADDAFGKIEHLRRVEIRKLASRIQKQRERLRWWEKLFHQHVHSHWRKAQPEYFRIVRRDMRLVAASARKAALEEAAKIADEYMLAAEHAGSAPMSIGAKGIAAFIRLLKVEEPKG